MRMVKSDEFILEEHLGKLTVESDCVLCNSSLESVAQKGRGIIEFFNGWWWICFGCKGKMAEFDQTQYKPWYRAEIIPYFRRSRKHWLSWLYKEYGITFT